MIATTPLCVMFNHLKQTSNSLFQPTTAASAKLLLHVLNDGEAPGDMLVKPRQAAFHGQTDVYISRAEIELRNAIQSLAFTSHAGINSFPVLTALSLPETVTPLIWTIHVLLKGKFQKPNDHNPIQHRNHDARLLFQQLSQLDLGHWATRFVAQVSPNNLPAHLQFPPGHPVLGQTYRRHPFLSRQNCCYPVTHFFSRLFEEREQALLALLGELGATKITITDTITQKQPGQPVLSAPQHQRVFDYPDQASALPQAIDLQKHPWLYYEPAWQAVVNERLKREVLHTQFEFDVDVMGLLRSQIESIGNLVPELSSMLLPENYQAILLQQALQPRIVTVEFSER